MNVSHNGSVQAAGDSASKALCLEVFRLAVVAQWVRIPRISGISHAFAMSQSEPPH